MHVMHPMRAVPMRSWIAAITFAFVGGGAAPLANAADALLPVQTFFSNDQIAEVKLSPSGRRVALIAANKSGRRILAVMDVGSDKGPVVVADSLEADISTFWWHTEDRLLYSIVNLNDGGREQTIGGLFMVKPDGSGHREVSSQERMGRKILYVPSNGGNDIIVGRSQYDGVRDFVAIHPARMDVLTGRVRSIEPGYPANSKRWLFDRNGDARVAESIAQGVVEVFYREPGKESWRSLGKWPTLDAPWYPRAADSAGHLFVVVTPPDSTSYLARFDFETGLPEPKPIVTTPGFDFFGDIVLDDANGDRLLGLRVDTDAETAVWLDPERKKLQQLADARFPGRINRTACERCFEGGSMLVYSYSDQDPGLYSVYRPDTATWTTIGRRRSAIDPRQMATLDFQRIKARDGLDLPVWVTMPRGTSVPRPAVVLVHGGPWLRGGHWQWNAAAQFLASRGYVVVEPEFRGSAGFGPRHFKSGFRQWGTTMQDDVADALKWAVDKGWVDPQRVCIAGGSYGGYATLMGTVRYPDLYRCGVAWVAVTDPTLMFEDLWVSDVGQDTKDYSMTAMIGDPKADAVMLRAASPVARAAEIKVPILMAFGVQDRRVPLEHGKRMRSALQATGQEPEFILYNGEGHGWFKADNRIDFWTRVEKFLDKNLH